MSGRQRTVEKNLRFAERYGTVPAQPKHAEAAAREILDRRIIGIVQDKWARYGNPITYVTLENALPDVQLSAIHRRCRALVKYRDWQIRRVKYDALVAYVPKGAYYGR